MLRLLTEGTAAPSADVWTVIGSTVGGIVLMLVAYFTRRLRPGDPADVDPEPEASVRKAVRTAARSAVDEYRLLIEDLLHKLDEDAAGLRRQIRDMQADLDRARDDAATWHRKHDVLQARTEWQQHRD